MVTIIPSILEKDISSFEEQLKKVWGKVRRVQMDIVDGKFAETKTVMPEILLSIDTIVEFEGHMMVEKPEDWIERCAAAGMTAVYGQVEKMEDSVKFIADAESAGMKVGLAYDIETPIAGLEEVINNIDVVLLMSVKAGAQGREFDESVLEKIKQVRKMSKTITIQVDGGLTVENIKKCLVAEWAEEIAEDEFNRDFLGIEFIVGSDLLEATDIEVELNRLENLGVLV